MKEVYNSSLPRDACTSSARKTGERETREREIEGREERKGE